jgi:uncharacterized spore protein YtfJ
MDVQQMLSQAGDALTVSRVFGEPYERDGVTIIPAASVRGGGGGGSGQEGEGRSGGGGGFGITARPAGAYVIRGGEVSWTPALDLSRVIVGGQIVGLVAILALRSVLKARAKRRRRS